MRISIVVLLFVSNFVFAQHSIKGHFTPASKFRYALLYRVTPTYDHYIENGKLVDGSFEIKLDSTAKTGIYKLVYALPQEDYNFDLIYNNEDIEFNFNSETGLEILASSENKLLSSYMQKMGEISQSIRNFYNEKNGKKSALLAIFKNQRKTQEDFEALAKNKIALQFIKANKPYIPFDYEDAKTYSNNLYKHYFYSVDFTNETLQSSNFLYERMSNFVFGSDADTINKIQNYKKNIDAFVVGMKAAPQKIQSKLLQNLWKQMADLKLEEVANYISDKYLIPISTALKDMSIVNDLNVYKHTSLGQSAPDFVIELDKKKTSLNELNIANYYLLIFWNSSCGHCTSEIPVVERYLEKSNFKDLKVIAIGLEEEEEIESWKAKTYTMPNFIHVLGLGKWNNAIGDSYGITGTPTYFVLDKNKNIIAKPDNLLELTSFLDNVEGVKEKSTNTTEPQKQ